MTLRCLSVSRGEKKNTYHAGKMCWARVIFGSSQLYEKDRCAERGLKLCAYNAYNVKRGWD